MFPKRLFGPVSLGLLLALLCAARPAAGAVTVLPTEPTTADTVMVTARVDFPMGCWTIQDQACATGAPGSLAITLDVQYCGGYPSCFCSEFPVTFYRTCKFGPLPAGLYTVLFTEHHINPYDTLQDYTETASFVVTAPTPILRRSWARLKAIYR